MKVLALDDQPLAAMQLAAALRSLGHEPESVTTGAEAWERLSLEQFRVVVSDWRMTGMDGLDLCRLVRHRGGGYIYFILVSSAGTSRSARDEALAAGVDDFLAKPIVPDELRMRLHVAERILRFTAQVQQLESFLPICSYCRKVRDDKKYWTQIESYLTQRDGTHFSHSVCPDCYSQVVVPELQGMGVEEPPPYPGGE
jgi:DNA-binding response OmpR family regulator